MTRILAAVAIFGLVAVVSVDARSQETQLRLATVVNAPHPWIDMAEAFKAEVEDRTEGRVSVDIFPGGSLGNDQTVIDEMRIGTVDFIIGGTQNAAPFIREYQIFSLNYLFEDMDAFRRATDPEGPVFQRLEEIHEESGLGLKLLALAGGGTRNFSNNLRPVHTPDDLNGMRMRVPGSPIDAQVWQELGAVTTSLPWTELYTAVQTGVVNAFESTISGYFGSRLHEVAPYHSETEHQVMMSHFTMADATWNRLGEEDRQIIVEAAHSAGELGTEKGVEYDETLLQELVEQHGVEVVEVDREAFREVVVPLHDEFAAELGATDLLEMLRKLN